MASVDRWDSRRWRARWRTPDGRSQSKVFDRKIDAQRFLVSLEAAKARGAYIDPALGRQKFVAFADDWAATQDWKGTSRDSWDSVRARLEPLLGNFPLATIDRLRLEAVRQALVKRGYARATTALTMTYASTIMRAAYVSGRIGRDPTVGLKAPKVRADERNGQVTAGQVPTRSEALAILGASPRRFRAAIALGLTGLRVGEVLGMAADRVDLKVRQVTVDQQLQRVAGELVLTTPKAEKKRTIVVPPLVVVELRRHLRDHHQGEGPLFRGERGALMRRDGFYDSAWKPALVASGLAPDRFVFHSLRHFCASTLLAEGAPLTAVAGHLGDTVETVSRTYVHWLRDDREVPAAVLERVLVPAGGVSSAWHGEVVEQ